VKIAVLHDIVPPNAPPEQQDNLVQAREVARTLKNLGHDPALLPLPDRFAQAAARVQSLAPDAAFNLVETIRSGGRLIHLVPLFMRRLGVPQAGGSAKALALTTHKILAKKILRAAGLATPDWAAGDPAWWPETLGGDWIVKSLWEHASHHLDEDSVLRNADRARLAQALDKRSKDHGGQWFAEEYIDGREFNISLLAGPDGPTVLPHAEIHFEGYGPDKLKVVGYRAKWRPDCYEYHHTPRVFDFPAHDAGLLDRLSRLSLAAWDLFGLGGWVRVDFRVDTEGRPYILEINVNPCIASDAGFMAAAGRAGLTPEDVIGRILAAAFNP
jgi:D-alanine-D-alanine ligase